MRQLKVLVGYSLCQLGVAIFRLGAAIDLSAKAARGALGTAVCSRCGFTSPVFCSEGLPGPDDLQHCPECEAVTVRVS